MTVKAQIKAYIEGQPETKRNDLKLLHTLFQKELPACKLWYLDGKDSKGKIVTNPNIGYGSYTIKYADGSTKEFYQVGLSANTSGISVYVMGLADKTLLPKTFGKRIGKATVTGYCIKFRSVADINLGVLSEAIKANR